MALVVCMGVSGIGKTTVAKALAARRHGTFLDADDFHPAANKQKMAQGIPLTDADRWEWLEALNREVARRCQRGGPQAELFLACSALKQSYRERLGRGLPGVQFVFLRAPFEVVKERLLARPDHFMPASLLASQFATLEEPAPGTALVVDACAPVPVIVEQVLRALPGAGTV